MTATTEAPPVATGGRAGGWRMAGWTLLAVVVVATLAILAALVGDSPGDAPTERLDPQNPGAIGAGALAAVLDDRGVAVTVARGQNDLLAEPRPGSNTTVVIGATDELGDTTAREFLDHVRGAGRIIVVAPTMRGLGLLDLPVATGSAIGITDAVDADCITDDIARDDMILHDVDGYQVVGESIAATSCFTVDDVSGVVRLDATSTRPEVLVVSGQFLQNDQITRFDNAGVAVRTFGNSDRLLWYLPSFDDTLTTPDVQDEPSDVPLAVGPLVLLAFFGLIALMFWRGRRFGPLVSEPLPAVVKAIETTQARGRMYHKARADDRAAGQLRIHTLERMSRHLGLPFDAARASRDLDDAGDFGGVGPPTPAVLAIVAAAAQASGHDPRHVHALLAGPLPQTPEQLVQFTSELTALDQEVRRTP
ncbi:DUF4350 domain-containing protein [Gordonia sp. LSe1-13]|uniref:DUF4350 domain-containing protein n=1 Tax=Gordonia sesuvii TaxID=3116777 RepID=A0ABU7MGJ1_9ACTN|nr:DUF4350 domain-containing protein [Gordonia sp. LSe1-13]